MTPYQEEMFARAARAIAALPDSIRVGGFEIALEKWSTRDATTNRAWGQFSPYDQVIRIEEIMPSPFKATDTLLHEISHAIWWAYDFPNDGKEVVEEDIVSKLGSAWMQVHRDNPWLSAWLLTHLGDKSALTYEHTPGNNVGRINRALGKPKKSPPHTI